MSQYSCSICDYISDRKENIKTHINKKKKCGEGTAEIIEIKIEITCEFCNKTYSCKKALTRHQKASCKVKKANLEAELAKKEEENKLLREELHEANKKLDEKHTTINNTTNNNINIIIQLRPYNDPRLPDDMDDIYEDAWSKKKSIPTFIERLHLSDEFPENHNMCITNLKTKLAKVFTEQGWTTRDEDKLLDEIITQSNRLLDKWVRAKKNRKEYENDFIEYLEEVGKKRFNEDTKQELRLMLHDAHKNGTVNIKSRTKPWIPIQDD